MTYDEITKRNAADQIKAMSAEEHLSAAANFAGRAIAEVDVGLAQFHATMAVAKFLRDGRA